MFEHFSLWACQLLKLLDEAIKRYRYIAIHLKNSCVASSDKFLKRDSLLSWNYVILEQEQNDELKLCFKSKLYNFRMIDFIEIVQVVIVVDSVDIVNKLVDVSVKEIEFECTESVEVRPGVKVKSYFELFLIDYALLVEIVEQSMEILELGHFHSQPLVSQGALSDPFITTFNNLYVFSEYDKKYFTVLVGSLSRTLDFSGFLMKFYIMKASFLRIKSWMAAFSGSVNYLLNSAVL